MPDQSTKIAEAAWEAYRTAPPTVEDIEGRALRNAWFAGRAFGLAEERDRCIALVERWHPDEGGGGHPLVDEIRRGVRPEDANS